LRSIRLCSMGVAQTSVCDRRLQEFQGWMISKAAPQTKVYATSSEVEQIIKQPPVMVASCMIAI
jgi:hypothetical protein